MKYHTLGGVSGSSEPSFSSSKPSLSSFGVSISLSSSKEPIYSGDTSIIESISVCVGKDCRARGGGPSLLSYLRENYAPLDGQPDFTSCPCMDECAVGPNISLNKVNGMQVSVGKFKKGEEEAGVERLREKIDYIEEYARKNPPRKR